MFTILIKRATYNKLIERFPAFMELDWNLFEREWNLGGVRATTSHEGWYHALISNLKVVSTFDPVKNAY